MIQKFLQVTNMVNHYYAFIPSGKYKKINMKMFPIVNSWDINCTTVKARIFLKIEIFLN